LDLSVSSVIRDSTHRLPPAPLSRQVPGTMQLEGGGTSNSYSGTTTINEGTLVLFKSQNVDAIPAGCSRWEMASEVSGRTGPSCVTAIKSPTRQT
jgi:autotransporter-associated beta strand protein